MNVQPIKATPAGVSAEETRARLLEAGLELFAAHGYDGVTTRQLAGQAGVNQAAIPYHFGGKEGLYLAVARNIAENILATIGLLAERVELEAVNLADDRAALAELLRLMVGTLARKIVSHDRGALMHAFVIREYSSPTKAFDILFKGGVERIHRALTAIVAAAMQLPTESQEAILRAHTIMGQVLGFAGGRAVVCRRMGWEGYDQKRGETVATLAADMAVRACGLAREQR